MRSEKKSQLDLSSHPYWPTNCVYNSTTKNQAKQLQQDWFTEVKRGNRSEKVASLYEFISVAGPTIRAHHLLAFLLVSGVIGRAGTHGLHEHPPAPPPCSAQSTSSYLAGTDLLGQSARPCWWEVGARPSCLPASQHVSSVRSARVPLWCPPEEWCTLGRGCDTSVVPLVPHVGGGRGAADGEADDEDVGLRVGGACGRRSYSSWPAGVPQVRLTRSAVHAHLSTVVVEHGGDVLLGKGVGGVGDEGGTSCPPPRRQPPHT